MSVLSATPSRKLFDSVLRLGAGEALSRLASFFLFAYLSRAFGVELLGVVALAQTAAMYVTLGTDQGLRLIGARIVARNRDVAGRVIAPVLRKRLISCAVSVSLGVAYALWGPVPNMARGYILVFVLAVVPYAFSLDWLAWGLNHFGWLSGWRAGVSVGFAAGAIIGIHLTGAVFASISISLLASTIVGALSLFIGWKWSWTRGALSGILACDGHFERELKWNRVLTLGMATLMNLMFNNFDAILLGAMTDAREVGRYSAAYKILFVVLSGYYLATQAIYPDLSRMRFGSQARLMLLRVLAGVSLLGTVGAVVLALWAPRVLTLVYGSDLQATGLLRILAFALPLDFCVALLGTLLVSRGFDRAVLAITSLAAFCNLVLNLWLIPQFQAQGAAISTLISYGFMLAAFGVYVGWKPVLTSDPAPAEAAQVTMA